ncbi:MAG: GEVED domain-containing protein [Salibacteraceae bacterium]
MKNKYLNLLFIVSLVFSAGAINAQTYCTSTALYTGDEYISNVTIGAINNSSTGCDLYTDYTAQETRVLPGSTISLSVTPSSCGTFAYSNSIRAFIDWNGDNTFSAAERYTVKALASGGYGVANTINITVPNQVSQNPFRLRVVCQESGTNATGCGSYGWGETEDYTLIGSFDNDVSMSDIDPIVVCKSGTSRDIMVKATNTGGLDLDTFYLGGQITDIVNNIQTPIPDTMITGNWKSSDETPFLNIFTYNGLFADGDIIRVWCFDPNNVPDSANANDTINYIVRAGMEGLFTIGDTTGGLNDFRTLTDAVDSLNTAGSICDSVIFVLPDTSYGTHYGQQHIKDILGSSPTSPIIFRAAAQNQYETRIVYDSCDVDYNYGFKIDNTSNVYFEGLTFETNTGRNNGYSNTITIEDCENIYFHDSKIMNRTTNSASVTYSLVTINGSEEVSFMDCEFENGSTSIIAKEGVDLTFNGCDFNNPYNVGLDANTYEGLTIEECDFYSNRLTPGGTAILLNKVNRDVNISYSTIGIRNGQWPLNGLSMNQCNALNGVTEIYNNSFNLGQPWSGSRYYGMQLTNVVGASIVFNTVAVSGNNAANAAFYSNNGTRNVTFNNIFASMISGSAIEIVTPASVVSSDHNDLFAGSGILGKLGTQSINSIGDWRQNTGFGMNSLSINPFFHGTSRNDLHVCNDDLYAAGMAISGINDDLDGDTRDLNAPCIGADEFAPVSLFSLGEDYGLCNGDSTDLVAGKGLTGEVAIWKDLSTGNTIDTSQVINVNSPGDYQVSLLNACGINVDTITIIAPVQVVLDPDTNLCPDETINIDATIVNGDSYMWSNGNSSSNITVTEQDVYYVTTTDMWKCTSMDSIVITYSNRAELTTQNDTIVCEGQSFGLFGGTDPITNPTATYKWTGYINADLETSANIFVDYDFLTADDTIITCELTHRGCVTSDSLRIQRKSSPKIDGLVIKDNGQGFYVTSNNSPGEDHKWMFGDGDSSMWPEPRHLYGQNGKYTVTYTNSNICGSQDTTFEISIISLSLVENGNNSNLLIYPNPNNGNFNLNFSNISADALNINIIDAQGKSVYSKELVNVTGSASEMINLTNYGTGIYVVQITIDGTVHTARVSVK